MQLNLIFKYILLYLIISISGLVILNSSEYDIMIHIWMMVMLCLGAVAISGFDLLHPYCWYSVIFTIYSISYPVLYVNNIYTQYGYSKELIVIQWTALVIFLCVISPKKVKSNNIMRSTETFKPNRLIIDTICIILIIASFIVYKGDFTHKKQIYEDHNVFLIASFSLAIILTIFFMFQLTTHIINYGSINKSLVIKVAIPITMLTLFSGERDIFFRFILVCILILYFFKRIRRVHLLLIVPIAIILIPLSSIYKYYFLSGVKSSSTISIQSILIGFLKGEFISASRNMQVLINSEFAKGYFGGFTIFNDLRRIFMPSDFSNSKWFVETFYPNSTIGYGFTLVGEGYINWGYIGVVLVFAFIALFLKILYLNSYKNVYYFIIYVYTIPIYLYSTRADLANIFSPFIKHLLLSLLVIYLIQNIFKKHNKSNSLLLERDNSLQIEGIMLTK